LHARRSGSLWFSEIALVFVRLNHVASLIVNANDGIVRSTEKLCVIDGVAVFAAKSQFRLGLSDVYHAKYFCL